MKLEAEKRKKEELIQETIEKEEKRKREEDEKRKEYEERVKLEMETRALQQYTEKLQSETKEKAKLADDVSKINNNKITSMIVDDVYKEAPRTPGSGAIRTSKAGESKT